MKTKTSCPVCRKVTGWEGNPWRPFCSERCKTLDLAAWASEEYRIPGEKLDKEGAEVPEKQDSGEDDAG